MLVPLHRTRKKESGMIRPGTGFSRRDVGKAFHGFSTSDGAQNMIGCTYHLNLSNYFLLAREIVGHISQLERPFWTMHLSKKYM